MTWDVIVVGGGPAGLSAALYLGRSRKKTLVLDDGQPRNAVAEHTHGTIGFDHRTPAELRTAGREALLRYPSVELRESRIVSIERDGRELAVSTGKETFVARKVLLATGVKDELPKHPGLRERYGASVFACPYCHGFESAEKRWGILISARAVVRNVPGYRGWTSKIVALLDGRTDLDAAAIASMTKHGVEIKPRKIAALHGEGRSLSEIELEGGGRIPLDAILISPPKRQSDLVLMMGLKLDEGGGVKIDEDTIETSMRGVYACGDAVGLRSHVSLALADGAVAGMALADALTMEDLGR